MTDANVTSDVVSVAVVGEGEKQVTSAITSIGLMGEPAGMLSLLADNVATTHSSPPVEISEVAICVLRNPYIKHNFQAIWVD